MARAAQRVLVGMAMDWVNEQQVSTIDRRERAQDVARRLGRQMPGQHVLVPYNGSIYAAQLSFESVPCLCNWIVFSDMSMTHGIHFFQSCFLFV